MPEPKLVVYTAEHDGYSYSLPCWEGTTLCQAWNEIKSLYVPGDVVTIINNCGQSKRFIRGMI